MLGSRAVRLAVTPMVSFPRYERRHGISQGPVYMSWQQVQGWAMKQENFKTLKKIDT
jgi:hypothetical protein